MKSMSRGDLAFNIYTAFLFFIWITALIISAISGLTYTIVFILIGIGVISLFIYIPISYNIRKKEREKLLK